MKKKLQITLTVLVDETVTPAQFAHDLQDMIEVDDFEIVAADCKEIR